ncbi:Metallo-peptidase family M12-domain-containing protein [Radiomyces spectabilis]|uniref:Metallo-peptidase family M12-domain-containing protein n=1 Tax=Radiomyces spectabilis TaxID=64574 RepID=UPI002220CA23|nr:Metallo-peptidase family M12-domain-containing protein [Radiomyces spectabilis]KAI8393566.1 Metallo-peptidase family M12-domain-containing protein [Radiomyces spectabilis]
MVGPWLILWAQLCATFIIAVIAQGTRSDRLSRVETINNPRITLMLTSMHGITAKRSAIPTTPSVIDLEHDASFLLQFSAFEQSFHLYLIPNIDMFHPDATVTIEHTDGQQHVEPIRRDQFRIYKGMVSETPIELPETIPDDLITEKQHTHWARITLRHDIQSEHPLFEGAFAVNSDVYHIKTQSNFRLRKRNDDPYPNSDDAMVIYRDSDTIAAPFHSVPFMHRFDTRDVKDDITCGMEDLTYNQELTGLRRGNRNSTTVSVPPLMDNSSSNYGIVPLDHVNLLTKRNTPLQGCPTARKIAFMGAAADCTYTSSYGGVRSAKIQIVNDWNVASGVFERTFNVSLGLIYLHLSSPECPRRSKSQNNWNQRCSNFYTINDRLSDFSLWRGKKGEDGAALWHLMTRCSTGIKVGIAWLSQLCETQASQQVEDNGSFEWVSGTGVSSITREEWKVVAHEIGHGFGAIHDCMAQSCPCIGNCGCCPLSETRCSAGETYLMNPTSNVSTNDFSPCSMADICSSFPNIGYCLQSPNALTTGTTSLCGNGILEPGEECDPGLTDSNCCDARTCRLKPHAICDDYSHQCCLNCDIAPATTVCRPPVSECDTIEYCTGSSVQCPDDHYDDDGTPCANGTMKCASGVCTSRDAQCIARGLRLNVSEQCSFQKDSCQVSCADPSDSRNCLVLSGMFLDGTECGLAGYCHKGSCVSTGVWNTVKAWVDQNKQIAIPVFIFGPLILLAILGWGIWFAVKRYRRRRMGAKDKDSRPPSIAKDQDEPTPSIHRGMDHHSPAHITSSRDDHHAFFFADHHPDRTLAVPPTDHALAIPSLSPSWNSASDTQPYEEWELRTLPNHQRRASFASSHGYRRADRSRNPSTTTAATNHPNDGVESMLPPGSNNVDHVDSVLFPDLVPSNGPTMETNYAFITSGTHRRAKSNI